MNTAQILANHISLVDAWMKTGGPELEDEFRGKLATREPGNVEIRLYERTRLLKWGDKLAGEPIANKPGLLNVTLVLQCVNFTLTDGAALPPEQFLAGRQRVGTGHAHLEVYDVTPDGLKLRILVNAAAWWKRIDDGIFASNPGLAWYSSFTPGTAGQFKAGDSLFIKSHVEYDDHAVVRPPAAGMTEVCGYHFLTVGP